MKVVVKYPARARFQNSEYKNKKKENTGTPGEHEGRKA